MKDCWIPRLYVVAQLVVLVVSGILIATGHNSFITDLFIAVAGGLTLTEGYNKITQKISSSSSSNTGDDSEK